MSQSLPNMLDNTIAKIKEMVDGNTVVGEPIRVSEDLSIIPISTVSVGLCGGGADYVSKHETVTRIPLVAASVPALRSLLWHSW